MSSIDEQLPIERTSPYGYRLVDEPGPVAYVPLTAREPSSAAASELGDEPAVAYDGSGQPVGPELWRRVLEAAQTPEGAAMLRALLRADETQPRTLVYEGVVGLQSDGSGNAVAKFFDVPQGMKAYLTRAIVDVTGFPPGSATNANAWCGIFESGGGTVVDGVTTASYGAGRIRAFAPNGNANGLFLPAMLVDDGAAAWGFRAGMSAVCVLAGIAGLATKQATVAYRFNLVADQVSAATA